MAKSYGPGKKSYGMKANKANKSKRSGGTRASRQGGDNSTTGSFTGVGGGKGKTVSGAA